MEMKRVLMLVLTLVLLVTMSVVPVSGQAADKRITGYELITPGYENNNIYTMTVRTSVTIVPYMYYYYSNGSSDLYRIDDGKSVSFTSSKKTVATISKKGKIQAKKVGTTTITVKSKLNNDVIKFKMKVVKPVKTSITSITSTKDSATITWEKVNGAAGYEIQYDTSGHPFWRNKKNTTKNKIVITNLTTGKEYAFRVRVKYKDGSATKYTGWSRTGYTFIASDPEPLPVPDTTSVRIKYKVVYSGGLYINSQPNRANCTLAIMKKGETFDVIDGTQAQYGTYEWAQAEYKSYKGWVCIGNSAWCIPADQEEETPDSTPSEPSEPSEPTTPTGSCPPIPVLSHSVLGNGKAKVSWPSSTNAAGYEIRWRKAPALGDDWPNLMSTTSDSIEITFGDIESVAGQTYEVQARAYYYENNKKKTTPYSRTEEIKMPTLRTFKVVYSGGLYINSKCNRKNSKLALMRKGDILSQLPHLDQKKTVYPVVSSRIILT